MPLTQQDRLKGAEASRSVRRQKQAERRKKAREMFDAGMSKTRIADALGVDYRTISKDLKATE